MSLCSLSAALLRRWKVLQGRRAGEKEPFHPAAAPCSKAIARQAQWRMHQAHRGGQTPTPRAFHAFNAVTFAVQGLSRHEDRASGTSEAACSEPAAPACCLITPAEAFPALPGRARQCDHASGFLARTGLTLALRQHSPSPPENSSPCKEKNK